MAAQVKSLRLRLFAITALAYLTGIMVTCFLRVTWRQFWIGVRGIWRAR